MAKKVFISYRRDDVRYQARDIYRAFSKAIPSDDVFMDVDSIMLGSNWPKILQDCLNQSEVLLALIGPGWIDARDPKTKRRRLDNENDPVRIEIHEAFARDIRVVPVLLDGTPMPDVGLLPNDLKKLVDREAEFVEYRTFDADVQRLIRKLGLGAAPPTRPVTPNDERTFYRRLDQNLTELDFPIRLLADWNGDFAPTSPAASLLRTRAESVFSAVKPVCEARTKVAEFGDEAILKQLNALCVVLKVGQDNADFTGGAAAVIAAKIVVQKGLLEKLHNDVTLKAK